MQQAQPLDFVAQRHPYLHTHHDGDHRYCCCRSLCAQVISTRPHTSHFSLLLASYSANSRDLPQPTHEPLPVPQASMALSVAPLGKERSARMCALRKEVVRRKGGDGALLCTLAEPSPSLGGCLLLGLLLRHKADVGNAKGGRLVVGQRVGYLEPNSLLLLRSSEKVRCMQ